ncbi:uncharacterized protein LOC133440591 [Cololabis saira]|uniref:uncharacterized protein LOC133440591 n=1 Tax=Cololabis saira TaxID=129043 RepID=UPI002AD3A7CF|nr:uncharacterized protein LOC133440591 [Cololabis saira]
MKTFTVAVAVAVVLTIVYFQEGSALPANEQENDLMEAEADGSLVVPEEEMPMDSWKFAYQVRQTHGAERIRCRFCCRCCPRMRGCGLCCRYWYQQAQQAAVLEANTQVWEEFSEAMEEDFRHQTEVKAVDSSHQHPEDLKLRLLKPPEMKTFTVAVAVAVMLTIVYFQEGSALPANEENDLMEAVADGSLVVPEEEMPMDSWKFAYQSRAAGQRRCRFCCRCCPGMRGCGVCCRF